MVVVVVVKMTTKMLRMMTIMVMTMMMIMTMMAMKTLTWGFFLEARIFKCILVAMVLDRKAAAKQRNGDSKPKTSRPMTHGHKGRPKPHPRERRIKSK